MSDLYKHLQGVMQEFTCKQCGYTNMAVFLSEIHYHNCPKCGQPHKLEILSLVVDIKTIPHNDLVEG